MGVFAEEIPKGKWRIKKYSRNTNLHLIIDLKYNLKKIANVFLCLNKPSVVNHSGFIETQNVQQKLMSPTGLGPMALLSGLGLVVRASTGGFDSNIIQLFFLPGAKYGRKKMTSVVLSCFPV